MSNEAELLRLRNIETQFRNQMNKDYFRRLVQCPINHDLSRIALFQGMYSKGLFHNANDLITTEQGQYMMAGTFRELKMAGARKQVDPTSMRSLNTDGPLRSTVLIPAPPSIESKELAGQQVEIYEMALARDIPFDQWGYNPLPIVSVGIVNPVIQNAITDLLPFYSNVNVNTIFRNLAPGDLVGPYISQFLYQPYTYNLLAIEQKYKMNTPGLNFMTTLPEVRAIQNGALPTQIQTFIAPRYIITLRDLATYVHNDEILEAYQNAIRILTTLKVGPNPGLPKTPFEVGFVDYGLTDVGASMAEAVRIAMVACWCYKWMLLLIRPEVLALELNQSIFDPQPWRPNFQFLQSSSVLPRIFAQQGNYLMSQAYPEGSPLHPSYPSGHAVIAGAATTIIKAFYDNDAKIPALVPNADGSALVPLLDTNGSQVKLRVSDELDKLASNISMGRIAAGIHYRADANDGLNLGEGIAVNYLQNLVKRYPQVTHFIFRLRNGTQVDINNVPPFPR